MKPFKWIKKHPIEAAAIAAALVATGGAAGYGPMAGMMGGTAAGAGAAGGAGALGAGVGGTVAAETAAELAALYGSELGLGATGAVGESALLGGPSFLSGFSPGSGLQGNLWGAAEGSLGGSLLGPMPGAYDALPAAMQPFAQGAATSAPGMASTYGPSAANAGSKAAWKMTPKDAMLLSQVVGSGQQEQRPMGAPQDMGNPMQRQAMMTQEQITKRWLLENDPNTYARIYGMPQGASYG